MTHITYRFGSYRLEPAARELQRNGRLLPLPRRIFDGLVYLIEHRDRAVGHDELIAALWGHVEVANAQISQLIMQVRRAMGDDSRSQRVIRTVPGFGYRWILPIEEVAAAESNRAPYPANVPPPAEPQPESGPAMPVEQEFAGTVRSMVFRHRVAVVLGIGLLALAGWGWLAGRRGPPALAREPGQAIAVLPLEVGVKDEMDSGWMRLGGMDLVAGRLRHAGLPVPPSESVISALHVVADLPDAERIAELRTTLGADVLVQGTVLRSTGGWTIELFATAANGERRRIESENVEPMETARLAADRLLAALGHAPLDDDVTRNEVLGERLQRAEAARLANELEVARAILTDAPASMRNDPELRYALARVQFHAGKHDEAEALLTELLGDPAVVAMPVLHAKALQTRGWIAVADDEDGWSTAESYFDAAVMALQGKRWTAQLGKALAERGVARVFLHRFDDAALDLGQARAQLEVAGDRQAVGQMDNYLGHLEFKRHRIAEAVRYFSAAADSSEAFGAADSLRYNLSAMIDGQMRLLRWADALATSERLWAMRERVENPGLRATIVGYRAMALVGTGRQREAEALLADFDDSRSASDAHASFRRFGYRARAELAWQRGRAGDALDAADRALAAWPEKASVDVEQRAVVALLRQRASIAVGRPVAADIAAFEPASRPVLTLYDRLARAEWASHLGREDEAEALFRDAAAQAETHGVPDVVALVAQAYARWLQTRGRIMEASARAGRIAGWADRDYGSALLQVEVFRASGQNDAWARALRQVEALAGDRETPAALLTPPSR